MTNILDAAQDLADRYAPDSLARYGADLLGRAIGHESAHERHVSFRDDLASWTPLIRDIRLSGIFTPTQQIMIHAAITDVMING